MKKNKLSENHHCIPQFYLNRFGVRQKNGSYNIHIYNKNNGKEFTNSVSNISFVKGYNTVKVGDVETDVFEQLHNRVFEKGYSKKLGIVVSELEMFFKERMAINCLSVRRRKELDFPKIFSQENKAFLSFLLAYFILRSKRARFFGEAAYDKVYDMMDKMYDSMKLDRNNFEENVLEVLGTRENLKLINITSSFNIQEINQLAHYLYMHTWNIGYNISNHLLYTCDSAHALTTIKEDYPEIHGIGYASPGSMIMFPLTPRICILMYDPIQLKKDKKIVIDCNYVYLNEALVKFINENIVFDAVDEVYSQDGDWDILNNYYDREKIPLGHKSFSVQ